MNRRFLRAASALLAFLAFSCPAGAQLFRAYLSSTGSDANPCTLPKPCRLLPAALAAVASGGEIWMLDSANYNTSTVTIDKSVSILAVPGAVGSIVAAAGAAVTIPATATGLTISLRNVVIVPIAGGTGTDGIDMFGASTLIIEKSVIANLPQTGVGAVGAGAHVRVSDTSIRNNGTGIVVQDGADGDLFKVELVGNFAGAGAVGFNAAGTTVLSVTDSIVAGNQLGIAAQTGIAGATATTYVTRCTLRANSTALDSESLSGGTPLVVFGQSMVAANAGGWTVSGTGATIQTLGNNIITGNGASTGSLSSLALQ